VEALLAEVRGNSAPNNPETNHSDIFSHSMGHVTFCAPRWTRALARDQTEVKSAGRQCRSLGISAGCRAVQKRSAEQARGQSIGLSRRLRRAVPEPRTEHPPGESPVVRERQEMTAAGPNSDCIPTDNRTAS
jgi:hypothetical protein